jgi:hypothetical protein
MSPFLACHAAAGFALTHSHYCSKPVTMPQIWERTLASDSAPADAAAASWNFSAWRPAAVVINLGKQQQQQQQQRTQQQQ